MAPSSPLPLSRYAWRMLALIVLCYTIVSFHRTCLGSVAVDIMADFGVGATLLAVMSSAYFYPYALVQIPAGIVADRWGTRKTLSLALLVGGAGALIFALATNVTVAVLGRVLVGLGMGMLFVPALRGALYWFAPSQHVLVTGLLVSSGYGGMMLATYPLMFLTQIIGWRGAMVTAAVITIGLGLIGGVFLRDRPQDAGYTPNWPVAAATGPRPGIMDCMRKVAHIRLYWLVSIGFFCVYGAFFAVTGLWGGPYFIQGYGLPKTTVGGLLLCIALGSCLGPMAVGCLATWFALSLRTLLIGVCGGMLLTSIPFLIPAPVVPLPLIPLWLGLFGALCGCYSSLVFSKVQQAVESSILGTATGMVNIFAYVGTASIQICSGWFMGGESAAYTLEQYAVMFRLFSGLFVVAFVAMLLCPPDRAPQD